MTIRCCDSADDIAIARTLFEEYQRSLDADICFTSFAAELASLPGSYQPIFLAFDAGLPLGCAALRPWDPDAMEMKRLYVRPAARGRGVGRALVQSCLAEARARNCRRLLLDTLPVMDGAIALYRSMGFIEIARYNTNPDPGALFFEYDL